MTSSDPALAGSRIRTAVAARYSSIGHDPSSDDGIPRGRAWAEGLGYLPTTLDTLPAAAVEAFTGIAAPLFDAALQRGERVLDLGCGGGLDTVLAGQSVGPSGHVTGVDLAPGMVARAREAIAAAAVTNASVVHAPAEEMPLPDGSIDVVIVNGLFNLAPDKWAVAAEVSRVLRPGGRLVAAEIALTDAQPPRDLDPEGWFR